VVRYQSYCEGNSKSSQYTLDNNGRFTPAVNRFPTAGDGQTGFKPLADYIHTLGLKFGIHILPRRPKTSGREESADRGLVLSCG